MDLALPKASSVEGELPDIEMFIHEQDILADILTERVNELNKAITKTNLVKEFKDLIPAVEAANINSYIANLNDFGIMNTLHLSIRELDEFPEDAKLDIIEIACEGFLSSIWDFIVKVCKAIADAMWSVLKFIAKVFGFDVDKASSGSAISDSRAGKASSQGSSDLEKTATKVNKDTAKTVAEVTEDIEAGNKPQVGTDPETIRLKEKFGSQFFDDGADLVEFLGIDTGELDLNESLTKSLEYHYVQQMVRYLDSRYSTMAPEQSVIPSKLMVLSRISIINKRMQQLSDTLGNIIKLSKSDDVDKRTVTMSDAIEAIYPDTAKGFKAKVGEKANPDDAIIIALQKVLAAPAEVESRNIILGPYGPATNRAPGYFYKNADAGGLYNKLADLSSKVFSQIKHITTNIEEYKDIDASVVQRMSGMLQAIKPYVSGLMSLSAKFTQQWKVDSKRLVKFMNDIDGIDTYKKKHKHK